MYLINRVEQCPPWVGLLFLLPLSICIHSSRPHHSHLLIFKFQRLLHFVKFLPSSSPHFNPRCLSSMITNLLWNASVHTVFIDAVCTILFDFCTGVQQNVFEYLTQFEDGTQTYVILRSFNLTQKYLTWALADLTLPLNEILELLSFLTSLPRALKTGLYFISTACLVFSWT